MTAVIAEKLSKSWGEKKAVQQLNITLREGEVFGFLGPNGAGKTTTIKLLNGMLNPTSGSCQVFGTDPAKNHGAVSALSGVLTEHAQMYDHLDGLQNLLFYGTLFGLSRNDSEKRAKELLETLDLSEAANQKLATYSTGMRQRLSLARALLHKPRIVFLDEPTSGLDPESAQSVNRLIKNLAASEGLTVFLCTHQLRYAQEICTSYGLINEGRILASGTIGELRSLVSKGLSVQVRSQSVPPSIPFRKMGEGLYEITVDSQEEIPSLVKKIVDGGGKLYEVSAQEASLEEIYFALLEKRNKGDAQ